MPAPWRKTRAHLLTMGVVAAEVEAVAPVEVVAVAAARVEMAVVVE
ncbi:MAG: hypothetical protein Fur0044_08180 [Anaerolineae bacterium]